MGEAVLDPARYREVLGRFATGVTVVTAIDGGDPVGFTCQAFSSLSLVPPLVIVAPGKSSTSWPRIARAGEFCVNILSEGQEALARDFAVSGTDKFADVAWRAADNGAPILEGALAWVECSFVEAHDAGDHEVVIGSVEQVGTSDGRPLLYYRGSFGGYRDASCL